jgi:Tfp pilus assembly protein PilO
MTKRDRMVIVVFGALAVLVVAWLLVVSPERNKAAEVQAKAQTAQAELSAAQGKLAEAEDAAKRYAAAYSSIVSLGQAVPAESEVPSLVYELDHATSKDEVGFESIAAGAGGSSSSSSSVPAATTVATAGFQQLPFTFSFAGTYEQLYKLMGRLQGFTVTKPDGSVNVSGRLLSIQGVSLTGGLSTGASGSGGDKLTATVTATAYVLPPGQTLTGGATATAPAGAAPASTSSSSGSTAAPAIVRPLP